MIDNIVPIVMVAVGLIGLGAAIQFFTTGKKAVAIAMKNPYLYGKCATCQFFETPFGIEVDMDTLGQCRRRAPNGKSDGYSCRPVWPELYGANSCGEWTEAQEKR